MQTTSTSTSTTEFQNMQTHKETLQSSNKGAVDCQSSTCNHQSKIGDGSAHLELIKIQMVYSLDKYTKMQ